MILHHFYWFLKRINSKSWYLHVGHDCLILSAFDYLRSHWVMVPSLRSPIWVPAPVIGHPETSILVAFTRRAPSL